MMVSPGAALLKRELLTTLRRGPLFLLMAIGFAITAALFLFFGGVVEGMRGELAPLLLTVLALCLHGAGLLFLPPLAAGAICVEKQRDTWPLLQTSLIPPWQIVLCKLINVLGVYLLIICATLPLAGVLSFFVGLEMTQVRHAFAVVVMSGLMTAAISILCSAFFYRTIAAILVAYVMVAFFNVGLGVVVGMVSDYLEKYAASGELMPVFMPAFSLVQRSFGVGFVINGWDQFVYAYLSFMTILCFLGAVGLVRRAPRPVKVDQRRPIDDVAVLEARRKQFPYYLVDPQRRRKAIPDQRNPMLAKELVSSIAGRGSAGIRIGYWFVLFWVMCSLPSVMYWGDSDYRITVATYLYFQMVILLPIAPALVANSVSKEYELGNLDMLRMTLLTPRQVVLGKMYAGWFGILPMILGSFFGSLLLLVPVFSQPEVLVEYAWAYLTLAVSLFMIFSLSLFVSVWASSSVTSLISSYFLALLLFLLLPLLVFPAIEIYFYLQSVGNQLIYDSTGADTFTTWAYLLLPAPPALHWWHRLEWRNESFPWWIPVLNLLITAACASLLLMLAMVTMLRRKLRDR